ncbi:hypothetical protein TNCV_3693631 [Trichonephila clavipes]|nr:hypothetical protein TNCV_3693631 [Trichonephila clavipes]
MIKKRNESENSKWCSTEGDFLLGSIFFSSSQYASTHHGAQQGETAHRSSDMRQARNLPQRWYWSIVLQFRDVLRQFIQGTPNCNTNPKATVFGIPKEPVLESSELITSRLTGAGSLLPPVYGEAWAKGHATGTPDSTFPRRTGLVKAIKLVGQTTVTANWYTTISLPEILQEVNVRELMLHHDNASSNTTGLKVVS